MKHNGLPQKQGLYDPKNEHDACGIGFVANIKGKPSHEIVRQALTVLCNLDHRGGQGSESNTGDGAGILLQIPHSFFLKSLADQGVQLPAATEYGVAMAYLPQDETLRAQCEQILEGFVVEVGQIVLGWRTVPTNNSTLGDSAISAEPFVRQLFIGQSKDVKDNLAFERKLFVIRKLAENKIAAVGGCISILFCELFESYHSI